MLSAKFCLLEGILHAVLLRLFFAPLMPTLRTPDVHHSLPGVQRAELGVCALHSRRRLFVAPLLLALPRADVKHFSIRMLISTSLAFCVRHSVPGVLKAEFGVVGILHAVRRNPTVAPLMSTSLADHVHHSLRGVLGAEL